MASPYDRAIARAFKLRRLLGAHVSIGDAIDKPKGMRWATFDRRINQIETVEAAVNASLLRFAQNLMTDF